MVEDEQGELRLEGEEEEFQTAAKLEAKDKDEPELSDGSELVRQEPGGEADDEEDEEDEERPSEEDAEEGLQFSVQWPPPEQVRAHVVRSGQLVSFMSEMSLSFFREHELQFWLQHAHKFPKRFLFGSMCTGSGMDADCLHSLCDDLRQRGVDTFFENIMMCEMVPFKQQWLLKQEALRRRKFPNHPQGHDVPEFQCTPCLFVDAKDVAAGAAGCCAHSEKKAGGKFAACRVKSSDVFSCGSSCKYFSHASRDRSHGNPATLLARLLNTCSQDLAKMHQSLTTFVAWRDYLLQHKPKVVLWENTDAFLDVPSASDEQAIQSNLDIVLELLMMLGYEAQPIRVSSNKYGTPQIRVRLFIVALLIECPWWKIRDSSDFDEVFTRALKRLESLQIAPPPLQDCLLPSDDPVVLTEFENYKKRAAARKPDKTAKWKTDVMALCQKHPTLRWGAMEAAQSSVTSPWYSLLPERDRSIITIMQFLHGEFVACDTSQSIELAKFVKPPVQTLPCLLPNSSWWLSFEKAGKEKTTARPLLGREMMHLQGFNMKDADCEGTTDANLADLAGNAFCGSVVTAIFSSLFVSIPWTSEQEHEAAASARDALAEAMRVFTS